MAKLVDVPDLGSGAARRVGSSPIIRTETLNIQSVKGFLFTFYRISLKNSFFILCKSYICK